MSPSSLLLVGVIASSVGGEPGQSARRLGLTPEDAFMLCAKDILGKPVLTEGHMSSGIPCPADRVALRLAIENAGYSVLDAGDWAYLLPTIRYKGRFPFPPVQWKELRILPQVEVWNEPVIPGSRPLAADERKKIADRVFEQIRPVPAFVASEWEPARPENAVSRPGQGTTIRRIFLSLDIHGLSRAGPESVIAILTDSEGGSVSRLAYGEISDGEYRMLWDSPLFWGWRFALGYDDINNDGVQELLLWSEMGMEPHTIHAFTILDRDGNELTRQTGKCQAESDMWSVPETGRACPIVGHKMEVVSSLDGKTKDILVTGRIEDIATSHPSRTYRYHLVNGRYVATVPSARTTKRSATPKP